MTVTGLAGTVAVVTGAGGGIGQATALAFAAQGATVVGVDLDRAALAGTMEEVRAAGVDGVPVVADVTTAAGTAEAVDVAHRRGRLYCLANVVGGSRPGTTVVDLALDQWAAVLDLNLTSIYLMCQAAIPVMVANGGGAIVNVSSGAGLRGMRANPAYVAAKAGVAGLTRALAIDHGPEGVRVNCVAPGPVLTPLMRRNRSEEEITWLAGQSLTGRVADPREVADVIVYLCSNQASYVMGQTIPVDGGVASAV